MISVTGPTSQQKKTRFRFTERRTSQTGIRGSLSDDSHINLTQTRSNGKNFEREKKIEEKKDREKASRANTERLLFCN